MENNDQTFTLAERVGLSKIKSTRRDEELKLDTGEYSINFSTTVTGKIDVAQTYTREQISYKQLAQLALSKLDSNQREKVINEYLKAHHNQDDRNKHERLLNQVQKQLPQNQTKRIQKEEMSVRKIG